MNEPVHIDPLPELPVSPELEAARLDEFARIAFEPASDVDNAIDGLTSALASVYDGAAEEARTLFKVLRPRPTGELRAFANKLEQRVNKLQGLQRDLQRVLRRAQQYPER